MCKLMILTGIEDSKLALKFMQGASVPMSISDRDGIGYSAINSQNELFMERWHSNSKFLDTETVIDQSTIDALEPFKARLPPLSVNYGSYGNVTRDDLRTVTMHTRMATCGRTFENTHPFVDQGVSLIHNGVIQNAHSLNLNKISTCDSEVALQLYINEQLNLTETPDSIQKGLINKLQGYWAFGILAKGIDGQYMIDIVREGANLYWATIPEMGENCHVFATTESIINTAIASIGLPKREKIYVLPESCYHRFNAVNGEYITDFMLDTSSLNKFEYPAYYSKKSLNTTYSKTDTKRDYSDSSYLRDYDMWQDQYNFSNVENDIPEDNVNDDLLIESFYNPDEYLIDRLYDFDKLMGTDYGTGYESINMKHRLFLERKEEEGYLIFDDILKIIEEFNATKELKTVLETYRELKRA